MARILLTRHGAAAYEATTLDDEGGCPTAEGRRQSHDLAARLAGQGIARIWTSPLSRAVQTAEIVAAGLGLDDVAVRRDLREYGVGGFAGHEAGGADLFAGIFEAWIDGDATARIPDGEVIEEFAARLGRVLEEAADDADDATTVVVTHGGAIGTVTTALVRDLPHRFAWGRHLPNCSSVVLLREAGVWRLESWPGSSLGSGEASLT